MSGRKGGGLGVEWIFMKLEMGNFEEGGWLWLGKGRDNLCGFVARDVGRCNSG